MRVELGAGRVTARRVGAAGSLARAAGLVVWLAGCGGGGGPALEALPQSIAFGTAPSLTLAGGATVSARASSGLPVTYSSATPQVCGVDGSTGRVSAAATCRY